MKKILLAFLKMFIFWMLYFAIARTLFLVANVNLLKVEGIAFSEIMASYLYALHLDFATACYFMMIPFVLFLVQSVYSPAWLNKVLKVYTYIGLFLFSLLTVVELGIYPEWKTKLPFKAFTYLSHPAEIYDTISTASFFSLLGAFAVFFMISLLIFKKWFYKDIVQVKRNYLFSAVFAVITPIVLFIGARGGVQQIPINQSESYYSHHNILNLASVNSGFNLFINIIENYKNFGKNPFASYPDGEVKETINEIFKTPVDTTIRVLNTERPNIVLIIMESWSADLIESLGGEPGITPEFHKLENEGILFTNLYATGPRSEQAMSSIFGGFPAHPISSITVQPDKFAKLPTLTNKLINEGYATSFYFGGQLIYGNIKGFILHNGFKRITEGADFGNDVKKGKLGVHDEFVLARQLNDLNKEKEPFFSALFTLSSHSPYDQPMEEVLHWGDNERKYINSAYYTDRSLGQFISNARKQPWFKNTLFIFVADHSHNSYRNWPFTTPLYHRIPLLLFGDVIKDEFKGMKIKRLSNQPDLASTLLHQLNISADEFHWSRNLFNPYSPEFAYYSFEEGLGWVRPAGHFVWDARVKHYNENSIPPAFQDSIIREGKSYLQAVFQEYMDL
ncbi:MAG: sulfatase-like hydrolase/transferase [Lentimicrobiaceae bacterium]|nr:sulfatase-like hydrolase/transferase [Lentimicrobiaceae bacterium]MCB9023267.1 sulfatase-like hydrolase/transferase [Lentimicrobiaceae bacterium]